MLDRLTRSSTRSLAHVHVSWTGYYPQGAKTSWLNYKARPNRPVLIALITRSQGCSKNWDAMWSKTHIVHHHSPLFSRSKVARAEVPKNTATKSVPSLLRRCVPCIRDCNIAVVHSRNSGTVQETTNRSRMIWEILHYCLGLIGCVLWSFPPWWIWSVAPILPRQQKFQECRWRLACPQCNVSPKMSTALLWKDFCHTLFSSQGTPLE